MPMIVIGVFKFPILLVFIFIQILSFINLSMIFLNYFSVH